MKKILLFLVMLLLPVTVFATGGGLRKNSLKTCPDGVTYGMHSDGNGGTHWHRAATNGDNYYADGDAIYGDPCPGVTGNKGTATSTNGGSSSSSSNRSYTRSAPVITKSSDTSIKSITLNGNNIDISDEMEAETDYPKNELTIRLNDYKAKFEIDGDYENIAVGENVIKIIVTAEDSTKKEYILKIIRKEVESEVTIQKFTFDSSDVDFNDKGIGIVYIFKETKSARYSYKLSKYDATLDMYLGNEKVNGFDKLEIGQSYKLVVTDKNGLTREYTLNIAELSYGWIITILSYFISFVGIPALIVFLIVRHNKKKNKSNEQL